MPQTTEELLQAEQAIQKELDRRAADQDAAIEAALLAGTLPEEDRRAASVGEQYLADTLNALPAHSTVEWVNGVFRVFRPPTSVGEGRTLARAVRMLGAQYEHRNGGPVLIDEAGEIIPAE